MLDVVVAVILLCSGYLLPLVPQSVLGGFLLLDALFEIPLEDIHVLNSACRAMFLTLQTFIIPGDLLNVCLCSPDACCGPYLYVESPPAGHVSSGLPPPDGEAEVYIFIRQGFHHVSPDFKRHFTALVNATSSYLT